MKYLSNWLLENKYLLKEVERLARKKRVKLYIVGGIIRDILLGRRKDNPDIDFCLEKGAINFARQASKELKSGFVVLDRAHGCARVVKKSKGRIYTLDFTDFRGKTLKDDLSHRDFGINSLAVGLEKICALPEINHFKEFEELLYDPCGGLKDLKEKKIRLVNKKGFDEDPLRIMRAFSLASLLDFKIDKQALGLINLKKRKITSVSAERVRDEIFKMLCGRSSWDSVMKLDKLGLLDLLVPEFKPMRELNQGPYHHLDVWNHSLETFRHLELILNNPPISEKITPYLEEEVSYGRKRYELLKLAALLHDIGKPRTLRMEKGKVTFHGHERTGAFMAQDIGIRFKLSNDEIKLLKSIIFAHLRPGYLADNAVLTPRAKFRFYRDTGPEAVSVLLVSLADQRATAGRLATKDSRLRHEKLVRRLLREYFTEQKAEKKERLLNGNDLIKQFKLKPSRVIGRLLSEIEEAQAIGRIKSKEEALRLAAKLIKKS
ncbi:MAG: HD domain-containing protein [Candidatus Omnitrophica bacterium]|nr:HD domain-containing protein [Candidatus Omnitrophota bacterium]